MIVVGGTYREVCLFPAWDQIYGSGLRASIALSAVSPGTHLHTFASKKWHADVLATLEAVGLSGSLVPIDDELTFGYLHPFHPLYVPNCEPKGTISVKSDVALCFGMIEGNARIFGKRVVYDPQNSSFWLAEGSEMDALSIILKPEELLRIINQGELQSTSEGEKEAAIDDLHDQVIALRDSKREIDVVIIRNRFGEVCVYDGDDPHRVKSYAAESFFRIGSGDVFAAAYAYAWGEKKFPPLEAADYAARCVAFFVEGPRLPIPKPSNLIDRSVAVRRDGSIKVLASGGLEIHALLFHALDWIKYLGGEAFDGSVQFQNDAQDIGAELILLGGHLTLRELSGLQNRSSASCAKVIYWPGSPPGVAEDHFPGAEITDDFATALYCVMRKRLP